MSREYWEINTLPNANSSVKSTIESDKSVPSEDSAGGSHSKRYNTFQRARDANNYRSEGLITSRDVVITDNECVFTIQEAVDSMGFGAFQIKMSAIFGLANIAESMELMLISVLSPTLKCVFHLDSHQESILSMVVFLGTIVSSSVWGKLGDKYGRKMAVLMSSMIYGYFGILTSFSPSFAWIVVNRFLVATGLGGFIQTMTLFAEFVPTKSRSYTMVLIATVWAVGACLEVLLAMLMNYLLNWRWLLFFTACPTLIFITLCKLLPESPRYLLSHNRYAEAMAILKQIAHTNGKNLPEGRLYHPHENTTKNRLRDLFIPKFLRTTFLLSLAMAAAYMAYFGTVMLTSALFDKNDECHGYSSESVSRKSSCRSFCTTLGLHDYVDLLITTLGDAPGLFLCVGLMSRFGRLVSLAVLMAMYTVAMLISNICLPRSILVCILFCARAMGNGAAQGILVYIAEIYPTPIRAIGMGWCGTMKSAGGIVAVFLSIALVAYSPFLGISSFAAVGFIGALSFYFLPYETRNKHMPETLEEPIK